MFNRQTKVIDFFPQQQPVMIDCSTGRPHMHLSLSLSLSLSINVILQHVSDCLIVFGVYAVKEEYVHAVYTMTLIS